MSPPACSGRKGLQPTLVPRLNGAGTPQRGVPTLLNRYRGEGKHGPISIRQAALSCSSKLSTPFHKYDHVCCVDFRFWRGATREHPPKWGCDRGATKPEPKSDATLQAAVLFGPDVVAHSLQTAEGYARVPVRKHLAPCLGQKSLAANVVVFMKWGT